MTEAEWLALAAPKDSVFRSLFARVADARSESPSGPERLRRFAVACTRRLGRALTACDLRALDLLDDYCQAPSAWALRAARTAHAADPGPQPWDDCDASDPGGVMLWWARKNAREALEPCLKAKPAHAVRAHAAAARGAEALRLLDAGELGAEPLARDPDPSVTELAAQAHILRDIFGNPFRPVAFLPRWRTDAAVSLARQAYESRDFSAIPVLSDALEEAGCTDADILSHLRSPGPHVRGCWALDLILGKS